MPPADVHTPRALRLCSGLLLLISGAGCDTGDLAAVRSAVDAASLSARASAIAAEHFDAFAAGGCAGALASDAQFEMVAETFEGSDYVHFAWSSVTGAGGDVQLEGQSTVRCVGTEPAPEVEHATNWCVTSVHPCGPPEGHPTSLRTEVWDSAAVTIDGAWVRNDGQSTWTITSTETRVVYGEAVPRSGVDVVQSSSGKTTTLTWTELDAERVQVRAKLGGETWTFVVAPKP